MGRTHASFKAIGVDEVQWPRSHKYLAVVYEIAGDYREEATLRGCFARVATAPAAKIRFVCSDMWKPYLSVIREQIPRAIHVLDRFHIVQTMNKAIDEVRAKEARPLKDAGAEPVLTLSCWRLLKRPHKLTEKQGHRLEELLRHHLQTLWAYLRREDFQFLSGYTSTRLGGPFPRRLVYACDALADRTDEEVCRLAARFTAPLILNWFRARRFIALGAVERFNNKLKLTTRRSHGFRVFRVVAIALYHALGNLSEPEGTYRFR